MNTNIWKVETRWIVKDSTDLEIKLGEVSTQLGKTVDRCLWECPDEQTFDLFFHIETMGSSRADSALRHVHKTIEKALLTSGWNENDIRSRELLCTYLSVDLQYPAELST